MTDLRRGVRSVRADCDYPIKIGCRKSAFDRAYGNVSLTEDKNGIKKGIKGINSVLKLYGK